MSAHAMAQIVDLGLTPVSGTAAGLNAGQTTAAFSLYEAFVVKAQQDARIDVLRSLVSLTHKEFDEAMTDAIQHAAKADALDGFTPPEGAKGRDKYGPKQSAMAQRASEARQIFGWMKYHNGNVPQWGYLESLREARACLKHEGIDWQGANVAEKKAAAEHKRETEALAEATKQAMLTTPKPEGMTQGDWFAEVAKNAQAALVNDADKATEAKMQKALEGIVKAFEPIDAYSIGISLIHNAMKAGIITKDQVLDDVASLTLTEEAPI